MPKQKRQPGALFAPNEEGKLRKISQAEFRKKLSESMARIGKLWKCPTTKKGKS